jgi:UPF0755 protein
MRTFAALASCVLFTGAVHLFRPGIAQAPDYPCAKNGSEVIVHIDTGATGLEIARELFKNRVVKSSEAYFRAAVGDPRSSKVAPGDHRLTIENCAKNVLQQLLDNKRIVGLIDIQEGMWLSEILPQMRAAGFSQGELTAAISQLKKPNGFKVLEGLLFPAQYSFDKDTTALSALNSMVARAQNEMNSAGFFSRNSTFNPNELLIIASLLQAEGKVQDFAKISQVVRNRLKIGMPLQFDSTVHYVKQSRGNIFLSTNGTRINSPYNTYRQYGLPPGPINNPGRQAMNAAMNPEPGNWLYFITVAPSDTRFTDKLSEFNLWKVEYKKNLRDGLFRSEND